MFLTMAHREVAGLFVEYWVKQEGDAFLPRQMLVTLGTQGANFEKIFFRFDDIEMKESIPYSDLFFYGHDEQDEDPCDEARCCPRGTDSRSHAALHAGRAPAARAVWAGQRRLCSCDRASVCPACAHA